MSGIETLETLDLKHGNAAVSIGPEGMLLLKIYELRKRGGNALKQLKIEGSDQKHQWQIKREPQIEDSQLSRIRHRKLSKQNTKGNF